MPLSAIRSEVERRDAVLDEVGGDRLWRVPVPERRAAWVARVGRVVLARDELEETRLRLEEEPRLVPLVAPHEVHGVGERRRVREDEVPAAAARRRFLPRSSVSDPGGRDREQDDGERAGAPQASPIGTQIFSAMKAHHSALASGLVRMST